MIDEGDDPAKLLDFTFGIGHAREGEQIEREIDSAPLCQRDRLRDVLPAVFDGLVVRLVERLVGAVQADAAGVEAGVDQERERAGQRSVGVDVDRAARGLGAHEADGAGDLLRAGERLALAALAEGDHGAAGCRAQMGDADVGHARSVGRVVDPLVARRRSFRRLLGDAADAASIAASAGGDGAFVARVEDVLRGEAAVLERAFRQLPQERSLLA